MTEEGWTTMRFDEFAERVSETVMPAESDLDRYIGLEHLDTMDLTIRRWDEGRNLIGKKLVVRKGDIIIARRNWYLRRVAIAPFDALCSAHAMIVRPKAGAINSDFFPFFLLSNQFYQKALAVSVGSLSPTINWSTLKSIEFNIPSIQVQDRVTPMFQSIDNQINNFFIVSKRLQMLTTKTIDYFIQEGTSRLQNTNNQKDVINSENWKMMTVGDLTIEHKQGFYTTEDYTTKGTPLIRVTDLQNPTIDISSSPCLELDEDTVNSFRVDRGDFLFARSGAIGRYGVAKQNYNAVFGSYVIRFKFNSELINPYYFGLFYQSSMCKKQLPAITQRAVNTNINARNIKTLRVLVPPISYQDSIVEKTSAFSSIRQQIHSMIERNRILSSKLMEDIEVLA